MKLRNIFIPATAVFMLTGCGLAGIAPSEYQDVQADKMTLAVKNNMGNTGTDYVVTSVEDGLIQAMQSVTATGQDTRVTFTNAGKVVASFTCIEDGSPIVKYFNWQRDKVPQTNTALCMK